MDLGWAGQVPATWKEPVGSRDNHRSGGDESGHLRGKGGGRRVFSVQRILGETDHKEDGLGGWVEMLSVPLLD